MLSQEARDNRVLPEKCQSEDQGNAEDEENNCIAKSESMFQSYCSRKDSGQPLSEESSPVSQESSNFNPKLLQCLIGQVQAYPCLWNKASPEYKLGPKKKLALINITINLEIDGKSIIKSVGCLRYFMKCIY